MTQLSLGADVEFLVRNTDGSLASVEGLIGGSKENPVWFDSGNLQEDNVLAEMAIKPAYSKQEWIKSLNDLMSVLKGQLGKKGFLIDITPSAVYPEDLLITPQAKQFGCDPDYNAWKVSINDPPDSDTNLRSAGGHVHIGVPPAHNDISRMFMFTRWLDLYLGVPSVLADKDTERRTLYGKAGSFRPKEYGMEYRTLSNFWVSNTKTMNWVWDTVNLAWDMFCESEWDVPEIEVEDIINTNDTEEAQKVCNLYGLEVPYNG